MSPSADKPDALGSDALRKLVAQVRTTAAGMTFYADQLELFDKMGLPSTVLGRQAFFVRSYDRAIIKLEGYLLELRRMREEVVKC